MSTPPLQLFNRQRKRVAAKGSTLQNSQKMKGASGKESGYRDLDRGGFLGEIVSSAMPTQVVDPVLSSLIALRDHLTASETKNKILDCFDVTAIRNAKRLLWNEQESFLCVNKKWTDHQHTAQRLVEEAKLQDLVVDL